MSNTTKRHCKVFRRFLKVAKGILSLVLLVLEIIRKIAEFFKDSH
jgi:hypothetical protein